MADFIHSRPTTMLRSGRVIYVFEEAGARCFSTRQEALRFRDEHNARLLSPNGMPEPVRYDRADTP